MSVQIHGDTVFLQGEPVAVILPNVREDLRKAFELAVKTGRQCYGE